jgi:hypothetical protein
MRQVSQNKSSLAIISQMRPSQFKSNVQISHRFRYLSTTNGGSFNVIRSTLYNLLFMNTSSSTTNYSIVAASRLKRIEVFSPAVASGSVSGPVSVEWLSNLGPSSEVSDSSTSSSAPAHVVTVPPPNSLASFWSLTGINGSEILFNISVPSNSIIDIWVDMVLMDGESSASVTTTNSGTAGQLYAIPLDGTGSSRILLPVSYQTLF